MDLKANNGLVIHGKNRALLLPRFQTPPLPPHLPGNRPGKKTASGSCRRGIYSWKDGGESLPVASSKIRAAQKSRPSLPAGANNWTPTGRPSTSPQGRLNPARPAKLALAV